MLAILEALRCFERYFNGGLIVESDSSNVVACVSNQPVNPLKLQFLFNEIQVLSA